MLLVFYGLASTQMIIPIVIKNTLFTIKQEVIVKHLIYLLVFIVILSTGCAYNIMMDPNIEPTANIANPIKLRIGVFIPADTQRLEIHDNIKAVKYNFYAGLALDSIIMKSTNRVFVHVEKLDSYPTQQQIDQSKLDLVAIAKVSSAKVSLNHKEGLFQNEAEGTTSLSVQMTFIDPKLIQITTVTATGIGMDSKALVLTTGKKEYSASVESALRNLGDDLINQMNGNYDIRKMGEEK